jgi:hypothetical protein
MNAITSALGAAVSNIDDAPVILFYYIIFFFLLL